MFKASHVVRCQSFLFSADVRSSTKGINSQSSLALSFARNGKDSIQRPAITITRDFNATPDILFQAWTEPIQLMQWFGPAGVTTIEAHIDLKVGGSYRLDMQEPDGKRHTPHGEYREIDPPKRLVLTWVLDDDSDCDGSGGDFTETVVTVEIQTVGSGTRLVLTQDFLPSDNSRAAHQMG
jgi:uncharacterized protein YndB with AHSA1/START domain